MVAAGITAGGAGGGLGGGICDRLGAGPKRSKPAEADAMRGVCGGPVKNEPSSRVSRKSLRRWS